MAPKTNDKGCVNTKNRVDNFCIMDSEHRLESSVHRVTSSGRSSTATWKNTFWLSGESLEAIIVLLAIGSGFWLLYCFFKLYKNYGQNNFEDIVERIKSETENSTSDSRSGAQYNNQNITEALNKNKFSFKTPAPKHQYH